MLKPLALLTALTTALASGSAANDFTRLEIGTQIRIAAPLTEVWAALADIEQYPDWNPYHVRVEGDLELGKKLTVEIHKPNGKQLTIKPRVMELKPGQSLVWGGGIHGIFFGEHRFDLTAVSANCTRLRHSEVFSGLFIGVVELGAIEPGYRAMNQALKERLETSGSHSC